MKVLAAFVFFIFIHENVLCTQPESVFQGKCKRENLCSQLCFELHDGMFECDCNHGYDLNDDGYTCTEHINISNNHVLNRTNQFEDDIFYQRGVSFSAKLDKSDGFTYGHNDNQIFNKSIKRPTDNAINIPRFYQNSWLAFKPLKGANLVTEINFEFRPELPDGILLLSGERDDLTGDFMSVALNNGFVEFAFDCGSGRGTIRSNDKVILHQWNTLMVYRYRWEGWIELNEKRRNRGRSSGIFSRITFRTPIFLGGPGNITSETLLKKKHLTKGFGGCIRKFEVNGHLYELSRLSNNEIISTSNINECALDRCSLIKCLHGGRCQDAGNCQCVLGFGGKFCENKLQLNVPMFNGTSNLRYRSLEETAIIWLEIQIIIKPHSQDGLILFSGKNDLGDFIALSLNFGFIEFIYDLGSGVTTVKSKYPVSKFEWHTIKISRTARLAVMKVDSQPEVMNVSPNGFWHLSLPYAFHLGGVSKVDMLPSNLRDRGFFEGCIKKLDINDQNVDLIEDALGGINIANCNESCTKNIDTDPAEFQNDRILSAEVTSLPNHEGSKNNDIFKSKNKYALDVVDLINDDSQEVMKKSNFIMATARIVRVSLQKPLKRLREACFQGNASYAVFNIENSATNCEKSEVNIRFRTLSPAGLLFLIYQENRPKKDVAVLQLRLENGFVHMRYSYKTSMVDVKSNKALNDGLWHRLLAEKKNIKGTLRIDGGPLLTKKTRSKEMIPTNIKPGLYIGGLPTYNQTSEALPGFIGCISDVTLNSEQFNLGLNSNVNSNEYS